MSDVLLQADNLIRVFGTQRRFGLEPDSEQVRAVDGVTISRRVPKSAEHKSPLWQPQCDRLSAACPISFTFNSTVV